MIGPMLLALVIVYVGPLIAVVGWSGRARVGEDARPVGSGRVGFVGAAHPVGRSR